MTGAFIAMGEKEGVVGGALMAVRSPEGGVHGGHGPKHVIGREGKQGGPGACANAPTVRHGVELQGGVARRERVEASTQCVLGVGRVTRRTRRNWCG